MYAIGAIILFYIAVCNGELGRIVGGREADITEVPYHVSVQLVATGYHICGGSILSERWVLTAGHCMPSDANPIDKQVVVGMTKQSVGGVVHSIRRSIRHPLYGSAHPFSHDVALVEVRERILFGERARPVRLPRDDQPPPVGAVCTVQGWGLVVPADTTSPDHLQVATLPIWAPAACVAAYGYDHSLFVGVGAPLLCAGWSSTASLPDTCNGDSGGALVHDAIQYGIVSFGMGCANPNYPKVFTNVYNVRDFIYANADL